MTAIRVRARVPESREVTLTLPPDVPVGEAELEIVVRAPVAEVAVLLPPDARPTVFPPRPTHPQLAVEFDAFERLLPNLMRDHAGRFVALRGGAVVAVADSEVAALTAARALPGFGMAYARLVTDQPQPLERLPSFREQPKG